MTDIKSGSVVARSKERRSSVERKSLINWVGNQLGRRMRRQHILMAPHKWHQKTIKARVSVNYRTCHTWLLVYLLSSSRTVSKSLQSSSLHYIFGRICCSVTAWPLTVCGKKSCISDKKACVIFSLLEANSNHLWWNKLNKNVTSSYKHVSVIKTLWLYLKQTRCCHKGRSVTLSILQGRFKGCTCCRKKWFENKTSQNKSYNILLISCSDYRCLTL